MPPPLPPPIVQHMLNTYPREWHTPPGFPCNDWADLFPRDEESPLEPTASFIEER
ncbi:hypothetical protein HGRIS_001063 [Hohenbuehelia grisea]|uniref:Uncharacterized protein n=1 Tax=Hohenbuehelia grisea TaxID=104357 RepID=A0ABR3JNR0_9AGAR